MANVVAPVQADALRAQYRADGVVLVKRALLPDHLRLLTDAYEASIANPGRKALRLYPEDGAKFFTDSSNTEVWDAYDPLLTRTPVCDYVSAVWGRPDVWFFYEQVFLKEGGSSRRTPWHQDASYLPMRGENTCVVWMSLDHVAAQDALEFVPGSHRGPLFNAAALDAKDDTASLFGDDEDVMPRLPDIQATRDEWQISSWETDPGDMLIFDMRTLHGGAPTRAGNRRRTVSVRLFGEGTSYAPLPRNDRTVASERANQDAASSKRAFSRAYAEMEPGGPFRHPLFRKVRPIGDTSAAAAQRSS
ncbi:phytanoyl-CoA dioxygenase family protein [Mycobacterium sp. NPDC003449]